MPVTENPAGIALSESEEHFRIMARPGQTLIWMAGPEGWFEFVSPSWEALLGTPGDAFMGKGWLDRMVAEDVAPCLEAMTISLKEARSFNFTARFLNADGTTRWISLEGAPRTTASGDCSGFIGLGFDVSEQQSEEAEFVEGEQRFFQLLQDMPLSAVVLDTNLNLTFSNQHFLRELGLTRPMAEGRNFCATLLTPVSAKYLGGLFLQRSQWSDFPAEIELHMNTHAGERLFSWKSLVVRDFHGDFKGLALMGEDITEKRQMESKLSLTAKVFDSASDAMVLTDAGNNIISVNRAFTRLTGYSAEEAYGQNPRVLKSGRHTDEFYRAMWQQLMVVGHWRGDVWDLRKDGTVYPKHLSINVIRDANGEITNYAAIFYDVTERKAFEEEMERMAHYDALTRLPNRAMLRDRLEQALASAKRNENLVALMFIDLDHFKGVNDTYGHAVGDELLVMVAERMRESVRAVDTVGRLGGDEFMIIATEIGDSQGAELVAEKVLSRLSEPYALENGVTLTHITPSIGISIYPNDHKDPNQLLACADQAMYRVKQSGRGSYSFHMKS